MDKTSIQQDESSTELEEVENSATLSATEEGPEVDNSEQDSEDRPVDPRLALMESIAERNDEERRIAKGTKQEDMPAGEPVPGDEEYDQMIETGLESQEPMHPEEEEDDSLPDEYADDPLAEFIEMQGDEPMFRTVVNGQQQLIPLEKARAAIQKNMAADQRLREANETSRQLDQREQAIAAREAEFNQRVQQLNSAPPSSDKEDAGLSEEQLTDEARKVVGELFTGTQDEAAAKLADLLLKTRGAAQVATNTVDPQQIAAQAVAAARQQLSAEAQERDAQKGYARFVEDYPEIAADDVLFKVADSMTDEIAREHPDWMPSEVMLEAGKRTSEWVESRKGSTSEQQPAQSDRTERKRKLRRVPTARQGARPAQKQDVPDTPADVMASIREARGQVV